MYKLICAVLYMLAISAWSSLYGQLSTEWVRQFGGKYGEEGYSVAVDFWGNVYTTGKFYGTADFDPGPEKLILTSHGSVDVFISKLDTAGNLVWVKQLGGLHEDYGLGITVDLAGNVYATGFFRKAAELEPRQDSPVLMGVGNYDGFIIKIDSSGNFRWVREIKGAEQIISNSIAADGLGNVYVTGVFDGTIKIVSDEGSQSLTSAGWSDVFIVKLNELGNLVWAKQIGSSDGEKGNSIAVDTKGNVYITGYFYETVDFDPGPGNAILTSSGGPDIFITKLDALGNFVWSKKVGGAGSDNSYGIATDGNGNVFVTGSFEGRIGFGDGEGSISLTSSGFLDVFVTKLDSIGNFLWAKQFGGQSAEEGRSLVVDQKGNVYATGYFNERVDYKVVEESYTLSSNGSRDILILKLDGFGNMVWAEKLGSSSLDDAFSLAINAVGDIYLTGFFNDTIDFSLRADTFNLVPKGQEDVFIAKFRQ